jgi:hypothetical protein
MPASWRDVVCRRCLPLVHRGLAELLRSPGQEDIRTWETFLRALGKPRHNILYSRAH